MNEDAKKTALRMIPYGLFVLTAETGDGEVSAATVNWVTQASFTPPLVAVGVKNDSETRRIVERAGHFALNVLGKTHKDMAYAFFKPAVKAGSQLSGYDYTSGTTGAPRLAGLPACIECTVHSIAAGGDHDLIIGEVVDAVADLTITGRPDEATLWLKDLGENVFYGG